MKKIQLFLSLFAVTAFMACQQEPSTSSLHKDFLVYTAHDSATDFTSLGEYFIPDSILIIGDHNKAVYWKDGDARQILDAVRKGMDNAGYERVADKGAADVGLQLSYVERVTWFVGADRPNWWWYYPYYWDIGYWGHWNGWHYPYYVKYGFTAGSLLVEMVKLTPAAEEGTARSLPVVWDCFVGGLLTSSSKLNLERTTEGIDQAFAQSPYLNHNKR